MIPLIVSFFLLSGVFAFFALKIKIKYGYKILINSLLLASCWIWLLFTDLTDLSVLLVSAYTCLTVVGVITHFIAPLILNFFGSFISKLTKQPFSPRTFDAHFNDGHRMYFCILLFTTIKIFSFLMFIAASLNLIK